MSAEPLLSRRRLGAAAALAALAGVGSCSSDAFLGGSDVADPQPGPTAAPDPEDLALVQTLRGAVSALHQQTAGNRLSQLRSLTGQHLAALGGTPSPPPNRTAPTRTTADPAPSAALRRQLERVVLLSSQTARNAVSGEFAAVSAAITASLSQYQDAVTVAGSPQ